MTKSDEAAAKPIPSWPRYLVDQEGRVYSTFKGSPRQMKPIKCNDGYRRVTLHDGLGGRKLRPIHRLVAETFLPPDVGRPFVNHKNGEKADNRLENLEWVTKAENARHAVDTGLHCMPTKCDPAEAMRLRTAGYKLREIAEQLGCSLTTAHSYVRRQERGA